MTKKTIVGLEPAEKTQTDGPEGLLETLPQNSAPAYTFNNPAGVGFYKDAKGETQLAVGGKRWEPLVEEGFRCEARDVKGNRIQRCDRPAIGKFNIWADTGYWVRVHTCKRHKP